MEIENIDFQLKQLITDVIEQTWKGRPHDGSVKLDVNFDSEFPDAVNSDPTRIRQILVNIVGNALKFTRDGHVAVHGEIYIDDNSKKMVKISVKDSGIGMSAKTIGNLFTKFTQADASISRKYEGSGLGLAICKRLVGLLDGAIGVESKEAVGSVFWFTFPYVEAITDVMSVNDEQADNEYKALRQLNILIAEDNEVNQLILRSIIEKSGHTVTIAEDGKKTVSAHNRGNYDLILMDVRMPEMDGTDATRIIRQMVNEKSNIPIIAVTADAMKENIESYFAAGMNGCVSKPIDTSELFKTIDEVIA